jgi:hypothetical protein
LLNSFLNPFQITSDKGKRDAFICEPCAIEVQKAFNLRVKMRISEEEHFANTRGNRLQLLNVHERKEVEDLIKSLKQDNQKLCDEKDEIERKLMNAWKSYKKLRSKVKMQSEKSNRTNARSSSTGNPIIGSDVTASKSGISDRLDWFQTWPCDVCHKVLTSRILLEEHVKNTHYKLPSIKNFQEKLGNNSNQIKIVNEEANLAESLPIPPQQNIEMISYEEPSEPSGSSIDVAKKPRCLICDKTFSSKSSLRKHLDSVHVQNSCFECDKCSKKFQRKENLSVHMKVHKSEENRSGKLTLKHFYVD